jgi:hypothetical protein
MPGSRTVPLRLSVVLRGAGYGFFAGLVGGTLTGVVLTLPAPGVVPAAALVGGVLGGATGLVAGLLGGVAFAAAVPCLVRHPHAARPAGSLVMPGVLALAWCVTAACRARTAEALLADRSYRAIAAYVAAVGAVAGALVAGRVLHGKPRDDPPGDEGADSLR